MLNMILQRVVFTLIAKVAGGKTARNMRQVNRVARMASRFRR